MEYYDFFMEETTNGVFKLTHIESNFSTYGKTQEQCFENMKKYAVQEIDYALFHSVRKNEDKNLNVRETHAEFLKLLA